MMSEIEAINRTELTAITEDGRIGEITNMFDADGEETDDYELAVAAVVKLADDEWYSVDLTAFEPTRMN